MTENDQIWEGDLLDRKEEALFLQRYIENVYRDVAKDTSFVLNINSEWGHGKTWFLKRLKDQLKQNHPVVYFDAWKNDFTEDALLSFVSVVCEDLANQFKKETQVGKKLSVVKNKFKKIVQKAIPVVAAVVAKHATGIPIDSQHWGNNEFSDDVVSTTEKLAGVAATSLIDDFIKKKNGIEEFEDAVSSLVAEIKKCSDVSLPICIVVDELDRCRPTYAIELLESIKHLFDVKGVVFLLATDTKQLSHSIKAVYGSEFASTAYLKRFFAAEYKLSEPNYENLSKFLFKNFVYMDRLFLPVKNNGRYTQVHFFSLISNFFRLTARDQYQVFDLLVSVLLSSEKKLFHLPFLLILIILKHKFEDESVILFTTPRDFSFAQLEITLRGSGRIIEQEFSSDHWSEDTEGPRREKLSHLFLFYFSVLYPEKNLYSFLDENDRWEYQRQILSELDQQHDLAEYFQLLSQAGRLNVIK